LQGLSVFAVCVGIFLFAHRGHTPEAARALTFVTLVTAFLVVLLANRSSVLTIVEGIKSRNLALWLVLGGAAGFLSLVLLVPFVRRLFHFGPVQIGDLLLSIAAGLLCTLWFEGTKLAKRLRMARQGASTGASLIQSK
jgi:Ca2+-transporting ATPase